MRKILLQLLTLCLTLNSFSQQNYYQAQDLIVTKNNTTLLNPWAGGVNVPQLSPIDLNNDGIQDLVIFDKNGNQINCYINKGKPGVVDYHYDPSYNDKFPDIKDWLLLRDYNCDGKNDIFTSQNGSIKVYKNTSTLDDLKFELFKTILTDRGSGNTNLYISSVDLPHIGDIDYDGDLDILTFSIIGDHVEWHKNYSMERFGSCDSLDYQLENPCWGNFSENFSNNSVKLNDCNTLRTRAIERSGRHAGSSITALDLTGNSFFDLLIGDVTFSNIVMLENRSSSDDAEMINQEVTFPKDSESINLSKFPAIYHFDIDNDDVKDLVVSPNSSAGSKNFENIWFYKNNSNTDISNFSLSQKDVLIDQMIDVGSAAHPVFFDYNNDGLMDLIVANEGYTSRTLLNSQLALYKNIGELSDPIFEWVTDDYAGLGSINFKQNLIPTFGDIDNDGDEDMLIGDSDGRIHFLKNTTDEQDAIFSIHTIEYFDIDVGSHASPFLIDIDRDDDLDLIIGSRQGNIFHYENQGTPMEANFKLTNEQFGNINLTDSIFGTAYSSPLVIDEANGFELFVGTEKGTVHHFTNIDNNLQGTFSEGFDSLILLGQGTRTSPAIYDLNDDGRNDILLGVYTGGIHLLWGNSPEVLSHELINEPMNIYPNPSQGEIYINTTEPIAMIEVYNLEGILCSVFMGEKNLDVSNLKKGMYILKIETETGKISQTKACIY